MSRATLTAVILAGTASWQTASAQTLSDSVLTATISQSFEADTNYDLDPDSPGTSYYGDTRFGLEWAQQRENHSLVLGFDTGMRALDRADRPFELTLASPTGALLDYDFEAANATFDTLLRYRQTETSYNRSLEDFEADEGPLPDDLTDVTEADLEDNTRQVRLDADVGFSWGTTDPSTYGLRFTGTSINYTDNTAELTPRDSAQIEGFWSLRFTPVFSSIVVANHFHYKADNTQDTQLNVSEIDAGVVYEPDENIRVRGGLGYANRQRRDTISGVRETTEDNSGFTLRGDFRYIQEDFTLEGDGRFTTAVPNDPRFSFNLRGRYDMQRSRITGRIFNRFTGNSSGGEEVRVSGLGVGLVRELSAVSELGLDFTYIIQKDVDNPDGQNADPDIERSTFAASYTRELTSSVSASLGYRYRTRTEDPDDAKGQQVFFTIGKTFQTGL